MLDSGVFMKLWLTFPGNKIQQKDHGFFKSIWLGFYFQHGNRTSHFLLYEMGIVMHACRTGKNRWDSDRAYSRGLCVFRDLPRDFPSNPCQLQRDHILFLVMGFLTIVIWIEDGLFPKILCMVGIQNSSSITNDLHCDSAVDGAFLSPSLFVFTR